MSYEICVFDPAYAADYEAAHKAWDQSAYWDESRPASDRSANKWRLKDKLIASDNRFVCKEPVAPRTGVFAKFFGKPAPEQRCLHMQIDAGDESTTFDVFDQAVEVNLPWYAKPAEAEPLVRDLWRNLERLSAMGLTTLYDTEREALLNLESDFDAVLARYIKNLDFEDVADAAEDPGKKSPATSARARGKSSAESFTGNVDESKAWWKR